jgi:hypothetical protein
LKKNVKSQICHVCFKKCKREKPPFSIDLKPISQTLKDDKLFRDEKEKQKNYFSCQKLKTQIYNIIDKYVFRRTNEVKVVRVFLVIAQYFLILLILFDKSRDCIVE